MKQVSYLVTLTYDYQNPAFQRAVQAFVEDTGKSAFDFEEFAITQFRGLLQEHLQSELGPEGIDVSVDNAEDN